MTNLARLPFPPAAGLALCACLAAVHASARQPVPDGRFLETETKVGAPLHYILKLRHSPTLEVVFPEEGDPAFGHFELLDKQAFPTRTQGQESIDSAVYVLATYETDPRQGLSLPVYIADPQAKEGRKALHPRPDSIDLAPLVTELPDTLSVFEQTQMAHVPRAFNYPYLLAGLALAAMLLVAGYAAFGGRIKRWWVLRRLRKQHLAFIGAFGRYRFDGKAQEAEQAVALWKGYAGKLLGLPLSSATTKEIAKMLSDRADLPVPEALASLQWADRIAYANDLSQAGQMPVRMHALQDFAQQAYLKAAEQVR